MFSDGGILMGGSERMVGGTGGNMVGGDAGARNKVVGRS